MIQLLNKLWDVVEQACFLHYFFIFKNHLIHTIMKFILTIVLIAGISFQGFGQRTSKFKTGLGYPLFLGNEDGETSTSKVGALPTFTIEKPIPIEIQRDERISINPGLAFFYFSEDEKLALSTKDLNHLSVNGFVKMFYQLKVQRRSEAFIYFGAVAGAHLYSRTNGTKIIESNNEQNPHFEEDINENGKEFFNTFYYGPVLGFQPDGKITNRFAPSFELAFYPGFVTKQNHDKASAVQLSVLLGFN